MPVIRGRTSLTVASGGSYTQSYVTFTETPWRIAIEVPEVGTLLATNTCNVYAEVCSDTSSWKKVYIPGGSSGAAGTGPWETLSSSGNFVAECSAACGWEYLRVAFSTAATDGMSQVVIHHWPKQWS